MIPLHDLNREQCNKLYAMVLGDNDRENMRWLCLNDLFFLMTVACKRKDINRPWLFDRCRELDANPDGYLDLWSREHYKSTLITFGLTLKDILNDPDVTVGIFSHTRPIAKAFLRQIKTELEANTFLKDLFPEVLFKDPKNEAPVWSLDNGIVVKRQTNPKESTVEAWGLVDGQPISKHFGVIVWDDVVTRDSVATTEQVTKTREMWELSLNLAATENCRYRGIGTRYSFNDAYETMIEREALVPRIRLAVAGEEGWDDVRLVEEGKLAIWDRATIKKKRRDMGPYVFAAQILQNPAADRAMGFREEWLRFRDNLEIPGEWNYYLIVDPGGSKKKIHGDFTVMLVLGLGADKVYRVVDGLRDRLNLTERTNALFRFHRKYKPLGVGYEQFGKDTDIEHIRLMMDDNNYSFEIIELGGKIPKPDRIRALVPVFEQNRMYWQRSIPYTTTERKNVNLTEIFVNEEYKLFPGCKHDDILDCLQRILHPDLKAVFPEESLRVKHRSVRVKAHAPLWDDRFTTGSPRVSGISGWSDRD